MCWSSTRRPLQKFLDHGRHIFRIYCHDEERQTPSGSGHSDHAILDRLGHRTGRGHPCGQCIDRVDISCRRIPRRHLQPGTLLRRPRPALFTFDICSVSHLTLIAIVKCCVIVRPLNYFNLFTDRALQRILAGVWIVSFILGFLPVMTVDSFQLEWISIFSEPVSSISVTIHLINFSISTFICFIVTKHLRIVRFTLSVHNVQPKTSGVRAFPAAMDFTNSIRSSTNLFIMTVMYLLTYLPIVIRTLLQLPGHSKTSPTTIETAFSVSTIWYYLCASFMNTLQYVLLHRAVKREMRLIFTRDPRINLGSASTSVPPANSRSTRVQPCWTPVHQKLQNWIPIRH